MVVFDSTLLIHIRIPALFLDYQISTRCDGDQTLWVQGNLSLHMYYAERILNQPPAGCSQRDRRPPGFRQLLPHQLLRHISLSEHTHKLYTRQHMWEKFCNDPVQEDPIPCQKPLLSPLPGHNFTVTPQIKSQSCLMQRHVNTIESLNCTTLSPWWMAGQLSDIQ